jgi:transcriptional regulator with XRE-family HTH domain
MKNRFREIRVIKRITQEALERKTRIDQSRISLFENGHVQLPADQVRKLARALKVSIGDIFPEPLPSKESLLTTFEVKGQSK